MTMGYIPIIGMSLLAAGYAQVVGHIKYHKDG